MNKEEVLKAIEEAIKKFSEEPSSEQIAFENGCNYTINTFQQLLKYCDNLEQENQQLKDRINMAIENIEIVLDSYKKSPKNALGLNINGLLDLLKGDKE